MPKMYPYAYIYHGKKVILIWKSDKDRDTFKLSSEKSLINSNSLSILKQKLKTEAIKINWSECCEMNFDKFWNALKHLKPGKSSSANTCSVLLEGWNFVEDLARTFKMKNEMKNLSTELLNKAYEKIFYGCNLKSITPYGKSYTPVWLKEEIIHLRMTFNEIWDVFIEKEIINEY